MLFTFDGNMCFHAQIFEKSGCERIDMSVTEKHQEFVVPEVKKIRGRPNPPPLKSCGDGLGIQLKYSFYFLLCSNTYICTDTCIYRIHMNPRHME